MFHKIDMETWERKEYYHYYINFIKSKYNLNIDMDITKLLKLVKEKKLNEEKITQVVSAQIKKYLTTEQNIQVMLNDYKHQKSEIVSDTSKFPLVSFALNINMQL